MHVHAIGSHTAFNASRQGRQAAGGAGQAAGAPDHVARHPHHVLDAPLPPVQGAHFTQSQAVSYRTMHDMRGVVHSQCISTVMRLLSLRKDTFSSID